MHGHQPANSGKPLPSPPTGGSGVKPPPLGNLLRGADRRLLRSVKAVLEMCLVDTPETLAAPERRDVIEEVLADVLEELGAKVQAPDTGAEPKEEGRFVTIVGGKRVKVRD